MRLRNQSSASPFSFCFLWRPSRALTSSLTEVHLFSVTSYCGKQRRIRVLDEAPGAPPILRCLDFFTRSIISTASTSSCLNGQFHPCCPQHSCFSQAELIDGMSFFFRPCGSSQVLISSTGFRICASDRDSSMRQAVCCSS